MDRLDIENKTISTIVGDRVDRRLWNQEALREAVRNAFVHNDYSTEVFPKFEIFADRLEITTCGGLPVGLSQEEFFLGYSAPRNKVLMRVFRDVGLVESLGIGIPKILETYDKGCFDFSDNFLRMSFPMVETGRETGRETINQVVGYNLLTPRPKQVLALLIDNPEINYEELKEAMGISSDQGISNHIDKLKAVGAIERDGTYGGRWIVYYEK